MKKITIAVLLITIITIFVTPSFAAGGNWSEKAIWAGDKNDEEGRYLASRFTAKIDDFQISIPVYDVFIDYATKGSEMFPITFKMADVRHPRPQNIIWVGKYNGFNEEKISSFADNERTVNTRFTCTTSASGNKFYGLDGLITWTKNTKRAQDRICVVWDSALRCRLYLGISFPELLETVGIEGDIPGYTLSDNHDNIYQQGIDATKD